MAMFDTITSRRGFLGRTAATASAVVVATTATATPATVSDGWDMLERSLTQLHPHGRRAALKAKAAGMDPGKLYTIVMLDRSDNWPALIFDAEPKGRTFRPNGEDN